MSELVSSVDNMSGKDGVSGMSGVSGKNKCFQFSAINVGTNSN